ncbi:aminotransferase class IV [Dyadobacter arcticus]|uniref:branched-chain-amino-acid transaminase n=1 Tax=Dyadobacter arcticus TaxID=1078754 RepID=A0ABX0UE30_9BACT|nr:aminotransferase class IV [Dyadobacter arcticus]NIJ51177.1 D-alanine transaminase/branched-chain amino acid aminotransferase [Dyadobacter arcticus]
MPFYQYFNGDILPIDESIFKTNDLGLLRGYGLFDYFRTYNGVPFRWDDYWRRFENSARLLKLTLPISQQETEKVLADLHAMSGEQEVAFRFVLTGGYAPDSVNVVQPNLLIRTEPLPQDNPAGRLKGIKVLPYEYVRDLPEIKSTNYVHMVLMADEMRRQQAADLLFHKDGEVSELTRSNIFIFRGNKLITSDRNVLNGITRKVILELAQAHFQIEVRPVLYKEVVTADEVFTTSTTKWVMPVVQIGDLPIQNGLAGTSTLFLRELFENLIADWGK